MLKTRVFVSTDDNKEYRGWECFNKQEQEDMKLQLQMQFLHSIGAKNIQVKEKWFMREVTLNVLANMMEKPVMVVLAESKMAGAILKKENAQNIYIDLDKYENYLDKLINEEMKVVNNYQ